jgi:hypothetical protein
MIWHYDVTGAEPVLRDIRIYNSGALTAGTAMCSGPIATAENNGAAIVASPTILSNIIGVLNDDVTAANALSVVATGVDKYAKLIINPFAVYLAKYSKLAADDVPLTAGDTSGKTATVTQVAYHLRSYVYITNVGSTIGGFGNLFQVGAQTGTTVLTAASSYDDNLSANIIGDTAIVTHGSYMADVAGGSVNLAANSIDIQGYTATPAAGAGLVLATYIESKVRPMEPLVCSRHSGSNLKAEDPDLYADLMFSEHLLAAGGVVNTRVIN